jgi:hypothetical protein
MGIIQKAKESANAGVANNRVVGSSGASGGASGSITMPPIAGLAESDFEMTMEKPKRQSNVLIFGDGGTGKTTFATRFAPEPVAFFDFDRRSTHARYAAIKKGRRVMPCKIDFPANITKVDDVTARKIGQACIDKVVKNMEIAVSESLKGNVRTICLDTGTEYAEILSIAITGRIDRTKGDYGKSKNLLNRELWRIFNLAREGNAHLIVLARAKAVWENNEPTGEFTYRGPEVLFDAVDWAGQIRVKKLKGLGGATSKRFELKIAKGGINIEELGNVYTEAEWEDLGGPFTYANMLQYPGTELDDWM